MLGKKDKKKDARKRLRQFEKRFDLKGLEKRLEQFEGKDLDKVLERLDWKDLEKKLEKDVARRYQDLRHLGKKEEPKGSTAGFFAGLVIGAIVGVVLAIIFGKQDQQHGMDSFVAGPRGGESPYTGGVTTGGVGSAPTSSMGARDFGDDAAIEREVNGTDDTVTAATDAVDSASGDVRDATEAWKDERGSGSTL